MKKIGLLGLAIAAVLASGFGAGWLVLQRRMAVAEDARSDQTRAVVLSRYVAHAYSGHPPGATYYGAFYSKRLPSAVRLPTGLVEAVAQPGDCDSQARGLVYLLSGWGIAAHQTDIFSREMTHSVVEANIDGRWVVLDPYLGLAFEDADGRLASAAQIRTGFLALKPILLRDDAGAAVKRYAQFGDAVFAPAGTPALVPVWLDAVAAPLVLGALDGKANDVGDDGARRRAGVNAYFIGQAHGSGKAKDIRITNLQLDRTAVITFDLVDRTKVASIGPTTPPGACTSSPGEVRCVVRGDANGTGRLVIHEDRMARSATVLVDRLTFRLAN